MSGEDAAVCYQRNSHCTLGGAVLMITPVHAHEQWPVFEDEILELPATMWAGPHDLLLSLDHRAGFIQVGITCRTDARV